MNVRDITSITAFVVVIFTVAVVITDSPYFFRSRSIRFLYRSGLLLYSRAFKVTPQANQLSIPQWKIEHWLSQSGFSSPIAEEDGEGRYLLMEFVSPFFAPIPLLMRGKISWNNNENNVVVRGYATWTYFLILVIRATLFFLPRQEGSYICFSVLLLIFVAWSSFLYVHQRQRFHSIGTKVAEYLSVGEGDSVTANNHSNKKAG